MLKVISLVGNTYPYKGGFLFSCQLGVCLKGHFAFVAPSLIWTRGIFLVILGTVYQPLGHTWMQGVGVSCPQVAQSHVFPACGAACLGFPGLGKEAQLLSGRYAFRLSQAVPTFCPFGRQLINHPFLPLHFVALCSHPVTGFASDIFQASG